MEKVMINNVELIIGFYGFIMILWASVKLNHKWWLANTIK